MVRQQIFQFLNSVVLLQDRLIWLSNHLVENEHFIVPAHNLFFDFLIQLRYCVLEPIIFSHKVPDLLV